MTLSLKDAGDLALHALGALGFFLVAAFPFLFPWANTAFWVGREMLQRVEKGQPLTNTFTSPHVIAEWAVPAVLGFALYFYCSAQGWI